MHTVQAFNEHSRHLGPWVSNLIISSIWWCNTKLV